MERHLDRLIDVVRVVARAGAWFGGILFLLAAFLIGIEVVARKVFRVSAGGVDELCGYALAIGIAWSLAYALFERSHISVDSLHRLLPTVATVTLTLLGLGLFVAYIAMTTWHAWWVLAESIESGSTGPSSLDIPLALPQAIWVGGLAWFVIAGMALGMRSLLAFVKGDTAKVKRLIGTRSVDDELDDVLR